MICSAHLAEDQNGAYKTDQDIKAFSKFQENYYSPNSYIIR